MNGRSAPLWSRLGVDHPIIQAPMAGTSTPALAAAVSNAGGLGSIAIGAASVEQAHDMLQATRALTQRPFNVNVFCHRPAQADAAREAAWLAHLQPRFAEFGAHPPPRLHEIYRSFVTDAAMRDLLLAERPAVVSFHFGLPPAASIAALQRAGIVLLATATRPGEARAAEDAGIDAIVAQGAEAGGHRGVFDPADDPRIGTLALTRLLTAQTSLPVIAAGGIMDGAGIRAALALGAAGVQLGTAFVACPESAADAAYRRALLAADVETAITSVISGRPARGIVNRFMREAGATGHPPVPDYPIAYDAGKALHAAARARGNAQFAAQWAGQGAALARAMPAAALFAALLAEMQ
ncbi:NAD(P)H-dependent flavin oxidoreductase [Solimonas terrae]|uniref:Nitronate monooxygenase n=1 Tax=Solimonas terrae TaxID=1396819 RepID=A0A6M2BSU7_9GAMM|nr:nitronate monooxygenase [Solimonas terrae]NGY05558.1 nitronate monooxygenase [Solimonas terrae]